MADNIQISLRTLNESFSGRNEANFPGGYYPERMYCLHPRQRAEVWRDEHRMKLRESILLGRYIPPIIVHEVIENNRIRRDILDGGNRVSAVRRILSSDLTPEQRYRVESYVINIVVLRGLDAFGIREQFRLLNKSVRVTDGHLYFMSREDSPLVEYSCRLMEMEDHPLRSRVTELFSDSVFQDTNSRGGLANIVALVAGAQHGVGHITRSFDINGDILNEPLNTHSIETTLRIAFSAIARANELTPIQDGRVRKGEFNVGKYLGVILYDLATGREPVSTIDKWGTIIARVRDGNADALNAVTMKGAQNLNARKMSQISFQVDFFLEHGVLPTEAQIQDWKMRRGDAQSVDDDSDEEN
jgi:hypothetical protein